ncbi:MAG: flotillin-like FloA family protein, partial [Eubacteriales bacterium]|nr:flotillin-like FloA family protein [Eubacteriales bacterium]
EGKLGVMDYYQMKNVMADTDMREGIAKATTPATTMTMDNTQSKK